MNRLILIGGGGHCRSCIDVIESLDLFKVAGVLDREKPVGEAVMGYPVLGHDGDLSAYKPDSFLFLVTVGQIGTPKTRQHIFELVQNHGGRMPTIISPWARVSGHAEIGPGTIVMHGATVNAGAVVGANCIINSHSLIEHDAKVGDHCHISTGAILNGHVEIGSGSFVGSGAILKQGIKAGVHCVISFGSRISRDVKDAEVVKP